MSVLQQHNLNRLLNPAQIAIIGGRDAEVALKACQRIGYNGRVWPVNPNRKTMGGLACYPSVDDLPQAPDAVFLAIPPKPALDVVTRLSEHERRRHRLLYRRLSLKAAGKGVTRICR